MENNKINIAEILKDCPPGTNLYSPIFGDVYLNKIRPHLGIVVTTDKEQGDFKEEFLYDGRYGMNGECMLFPSKDKTTWEGFQRPFQDGDIIFTCAVFNGICSDYLYTGLYYTWISIFHKMHKDQVITYVDIENSGKYFPFWMRKGELCRKNDISYQRLATEEEKERLFKFIKDNGYKWNVETKTLEKLVEPKFKVGDRIRCKNDTDKYNGVEEGEIVSITDNTYGITIPYLTDIVTHISIVEQDEWELVSDEIKPKFKVGDIIKHRLTGEIYTVMFVLPHGGGTYEVAITNELCQSISIKEQDIYELVSDEIEPNFKDGDIISDPLFNTICIFKREGNHSGTVDFYCGRDYIGNLVIKDSNKPDSHFGNIVDYKLATEEEKHKLFDAIGVNGLKWNAETKTLEKSTIPKYKFRRSRTANDLIEQFRKTPVNTLDIPIVVDDKEVGDVQFVYDEKRKKYVFNLLLKDK